MIEKKAQHWKMLLINNGMQEKIIKIINYTGEAHFMMSFIPPLVAMLHFLASGASNHNGVPNRNHEIKKIIIMYPISLNLIQYFKI